MHKPKCCCSVCWAHHYCDACNAFPMPVTNQPAPATPPPTLLTDLTSRLLKMCAKWP